MTNPTPKDSQVDQLAQHVAALEAMLRSMATGSTTDLAALAEGYTTLTERLAALETTPDKPAAKTPAAWVDVATKGAWADLGSWVNWLVVTYDVKLDRTILPCWPAHSGVAEELAALYSSWRFAALSARANRNEREMSTWHERSLHPTLVRLRQGYAYELCSRGGHRASKLEHEYTDTGQLQTMIGQAPDDPPAKDAA